MRDIHLLKKQGLTIEEEEDDNDVNFTSYIPFHSIDFDSIYLPLTILIFFFYSLRAKFSKPRTITKIEELVKLARQYEQLLDSHKISPISTFQILGIIKKDFLDVFMVGVNSGEVLDDIDDVASTLNQSKNANTTNNEGGNIIEIDRHCGKEIPPPVVNSLEILKVEYPNTDCEEFIRYASAFPTVNPQKPNVKLLSSYRKMLLWRANEFPNLGGSSSPVETSFFPSLDEYPEFPIEWCQLSPKPTKSGIPAIFVQGANSDTNIPNIAYLQRACFLVDSLFPSESTPGKFAIVVDTRPNPKWKNPPASSFLTIFKELGEMLTTYYPERFSFLIMYPVPYILKVVVNLVKGAVDREIGEGFRVICGKGHAEAKAPKKLLDFIDVEGIPEYARERHLEWE